MRQLALIATVLLAGFPFCATADILTEGFDDPLGSFYDDWLGSNSNLGSYYLSSPSYDCDPNFRGNTGNGGLWLSGNQVCNGGVSERTVTIMFDLAFGSTLTYLSFGVEAFQETTVSIFDVAGSLLATSVFSGGKFTFDHSDVISASSSNGIGSFSFASVFQVSGNLSVDNFYAETAMTSVPEPGTLALLSIGLLGMGLARRRKKS